MEYGVKVKIPDGRKIRANSKQDPLDKLYEYVVRTVMPNLDTLGLTWIEACKRMDITVSDFHMNEADFNEIFEPKIMKYYGKEHRSKKRLQKLLMWYRLDRSPRFDPTMERGYVGISLP